jgi:hypothetical protein
MAGCNFSIPFTVDPEIILTKAKSAVESQSGTFNGDITSGNFEVSVFSNLIKGNYKVVGQQLNLNISDKPFMIPCSAIESFLKSQLS